MTRLMIVCPALAAGLLMLGGCDSGAPQENGSADASSATLASLISDADDLDEVSGALDQAGLTQAFDGVASYTVLAPNDEAFAALAPVEQNLPEEDRGAVLAAVLRDHILPGYLTPEDIGKAIEAQQSGTVSIQTMGDSTLTFAMEGEAIRVTSSDGSSAILLGEGLRGSNGVAIPIDAVLTELPG